MERIEYDEFGLFHENAGEYSIPFFSSPRVRRVETALTDGRMLSSLVWGANEPQLVLLHGGAQNAHTWDTVALALGVSLVCIDLPGHGHSGPPLDGTVNARTNAADVAEVIRALAPQARAVVGMSLGGMTTLALMGHAPELVRKALFVDVTPGVNAKKASAIVAFVAGPPSFPSFEQLLERTIEHNPTRTVASLRRGILHNARQLDDGSWVWRYGSLKMAPGEEGHPNFADLWDVLGNSTMPVCLARGMRKGSVVDDDDEAEFLRRRPDGRVEHFAEAGHSIQGDMPVELAHLIADFAL